MIRRKTIAVLATLDTKGEEAAYLRGRLENLNCSAVIIDIGPLGPPGVSPDIDNREVARHEGCDLTALLKSGQRDRIMEVMGRGARKLLSLLFYEGKIDGVIGLGGNQGSAVSSIAMQGLPFGFPKYLVSTVASGNIRPYIGNKDINVLFSVGDFLGGANPVISSILANAAAAVVGMANSGERMIATPGKMNIAVTSLGNTEQAARRAVASLRAAGFEVVAFHASGAGGSAMEELITDGMIDGVLDLTPHELTEEVLGAGIYRPVLPGRMSAAGAKGIPQVVSTGGMEYICFGPRESIPLRLRKRKTTMHNPFNSNVKVSRREMSLVGSVMADRLNAASGPTAVFIPLKGWSVYGAPGGALHDSAGNLSFIKALKYRLRKEIEIKEINAEINDDLFVDACVNQLITYMKDVKELHKP